ncbi:MAG: DUF1735 domain-containing protein [Tannerella sp.]|jgi:hypothetical protein|nr:DUF1735 domain-containing protein [Tannerella sp.]
MKKKIVNYKTLTALALALMLPFSSCNDEEEKGENLPAAKVYFNDSDATKDNVYDLPILNVGETETFNLALCKSGVDNTAATVKIAVLTQTELNEYNTVHGKNFTLLTTDSYSISETSIAFSGSDVSKTVPVVFDVAALREEEENAVLPVKITEAAPAEINSEKSLIVIRPSVQEVLISFHNGGEVSKTWVEGALGEVELSFSIEARVGIEVNEWAIDVTIAVDGTYVTQYNEEHQTAYQLLDAESYTLQTSKTINTGEIAASFSLEIDGENLEAGRYLLPVRLSSSSKFDIDANSLFYVKIDVTATVPDADYLDRTGWEITGNTEEVIGESDGNNGKFIHALDDNVNTYWHSQWKNGAIEPPFILVIDMKDAYTITTVGLINRQFDEGQKNQRAIKSGNIAISNNSNAWDSNFWTDNSVWTEIGSFTDLPQILEEQPVNVTPTSGRYLKITLTNTWHWDSKVSSVAEIKPKGY